MLHTSIMWWQQHARLLYTFQAQNHHVRTRIYVA
jgi:hypothetical protein